jgi:FAD/FMN-containing dehydrogenase
MAIDVLAKGSDGYEANRGAMNLLVDQAPAAIVTPRSAADVAEAITYAKTAGLRVTAQLRGHLAEPLGDLGDTLLVRTGAMNEVSIDARTRIARVGAGAVWGDLVPRASELGLAALHGSSPTVGIVGYSLIGGLGYYARKHGMQCNRVTAIELVDADGAERRVDADNDPELFWALRGGGGDFGVVTAIEFELLPIAEVFAGKLLIPIERAADLFHAWHAFTETAPEEVTSLLRVMRYPDSPELEAPYRGNSLAILEAAVLLGEAEATELLAPMRDLPGVVLDTFEMRPPVDVVTLHGIPEDPVGWATANGVLLGDMGTADIDTLLAAIGPDSDIGLISIELRQDGGALARSGDGHGAMDTVPGSFFLYGVGLVFAPEEEAPSKAWLEELEDAVKPWDVGRYMGFCDAPQDIGLGFPPATLERLRAAKAKYDPENLFHVAHPVVAG